MEFDCSAGRYPSTSLEAALACETSGTWGPQHFLNPILIYVAIQNGLVAFLIPGLNEIAETIIRSRTSTRADAEHSGLSDYESPLGSLVFDWLMQGSSVFLVGIPLVQVLGLQTRETLLWSRRLLWSLVLVGLTCLVEGLFARLASHKDHDLAALGFVLVGLTNVLGFWLITLVNAQSDANCKNAGCLSVRCMGCGPCLPGFNWTKSLRNCLVYGLIVAAVLFAGSGMGRNRQTAYVWMLSTEAIVVVVLWIWLSVVVSEHMKGVYWFLKREGLML